MLLVKSSLDLDTSFDFFVIIIELSIKPSRDPKTDRPATLIRVATLGWEPLV